MAQAPTFSSRSIPDNSDDMQSEIKKIRSELQQEQRKRKKLEDKVSKINEQQEAYRLVTTRLSAVEDFLKSTFRVMTSKQKPPRAAWLKTTFEARLSLDKNWPLVSGIVILPGGDILIVDYKNNKVKCFDSQFCLLHVTMIGPQCIYLADLRDGRVALLYENKEFEVIRVTKSGIVKEMETIVDKTYIGLAALDPQTLACSVSGECKVDVHDLFLFQFVRSIETSEMVNYMILSEDGSLVCTGNGTGTLKINPVSGLETLKKSVPGIGELAGVATTEDNYIIVGDLCKRTIHLLSSTDDLVRTLGSIPQNDHSGHLRHIAVLGDMLVCATHSKIYVFELLY